MHSNPTHPPVASDGERALGHGDSAAFPPPSPRLSPDPGHSRWRGLAGLRTVLYITAALLVGAMVLLVATDEPNTAANTDRDTPRESQDRSFIAGLDKPGEPLDQPIPVPTRDWQGWDRYSTGRCAWMPPGLLSPLEPTEPPRPTSAGCVVPISGGGTVFVNWGPPEKRLLWYSTKGSDRGEVVGELITVAGLEARATELFFLTVLFPGICRVDVNTRSLTGLTVLAWNPPAAANGCEVVETAANLVAHAVVPAAGGTPWTDTPQQPTPLALVGRGSCELLIAGVDPLGELANGQPVISGNDTMQRCTLLRGDTEVRAWVTPTSASDRPDAEGAAVRRLGPLRAWEKETADTCTITTEVLPGHLLAVSCHGQGRTAARCAASELITANAVRPSSTEARPEHEAQTAASVNLLPDSLIGRKAGKVR